MKINWATVAAISGVIAMVVLFSIDKFGGSAATMDCRVKNLETASAVMKSTLEIELRNISDRLRNIERKLK